MRILHVIRTLDPGSGGPAEGVRNLTVAAVAAGHHVEVLCLDDPSSPWLSPWDNTAHALGSCRFAYGFSTAVDKWLSNNIGSFDAVIVNGIWMYHSQAARRAAIKNGVPYYVFIHGALDPWFRRYRVKHLKKKVYWKLFEHRVLRDADAVLFTTKEEQELARNAFLPYDCRARVSGFGVGRPPGYGVMDRRPAWRAFAASHPSLNDRHYLLYLARIHEKKGLDLALRAFSATKTMLSNTALVVVGHGDERFVRNLKDLARSLGIEDDVIWTGALYNDDKWNVIRAADAYILPSHQENFGISVVESLACGVPVLISDKINIWREVVSDAAGFVGSDTLSGTIRNLEQWAVLSDHGRSEMGNNGLNCFRKHFDVDVTWKRLRSILERGRAKAAVY